MTTIKATCPVCGDVDLTPSDVRLTVAESAGWATYTFRCSECHDNVEKPADEEVVALLSSTGVAIDRVPAEALEGHLSKLHGLIISKDVEKNNRKFKDASTADQVYALLESDL